METLHYEIECLRKKMHETALKNGISHPDVLRVSEKLDEVIYEFYKLTLVQKAG